MITHAIAAAKQAGSIIKQNFAAPSHQPVTYKDEHSIVTETDIAAEQAIFAILKKEFPDHSFFSEEAGLIKNDSEYLWVIDPLDGTSNFAQGLPFFCVSIALFKNKQPILGVIYDPIHDELFTAEDEKGAFLNGEKITPNGTHKVLQAITVLGRGASQEAKNRHAKLYTTITTHTRTNRILGSIALSIVHAACGRFDVAIINDSNFYDCAAANIIARESGALVTDFAGNLLTHETEGTNDILIASPNLQQELIQILSTY